MSLVFGDILNRRKYCASIKISLASIYVRNEETRANQGSSSQSGYGRAFWRRGETLLFQVQQGLLCLLPLLRQVVVLLPELRSGHLQCQCGGMYDVQQLLHGMQ
jgi:hypothetical protein